MGLDFNFEKFINLFTGTFLLISSISLSLYIKIILSFSKFISLEIISFISDILQFGFIEI